MPFFSVVIPLYNKEAYIADTLNSVLNQTFEDFEVIIVNDGSTDGSLEMASSFKDQRIKIFNQINQGASVARNNGIEQAQSEFIALLDADDIWYKNHLEELKKLIETFPEAGLFCSRYKTKISKKRMVKHDFGGFIDKDYRGIVPDFFKASLVDRVAHTSAIVVPKNTFNEYGGFEKTISSGQDLDLWIRIAANCEVVISNETTCIYRFEIPASLSKTPIISKQLVDFKKYEELEKRNKSLKQFLDLYRLEYAIHYRVGGNLLKSKEMLNDIKSYIPLIPKILLTLPPIILKTLLIIKHRLKKAGIVFTIYR
ncbi:glycosyltransferase family 2 protein [Aestuariivivens sp. NBU2969]|uniref:glycosyltransferase family 2 protein n=1 Tax=Aestuariivivens sp. NBU2969 TaxID=2873267 RepID=UPI001CBDE01B|nr:glycosyltransferase family 2 protein [Aestuariivivens sp. NBU2969]